MSIRYHKPPTWPELLQWWEEGSARCLVNFFFGCGECRNPVNDPGDDDDILRILVHFNEAGNEEAEPDDANTMALIAETFSCDTHRRDDNHIARFVYYWLGLDDSMAIVGCIAWVLGINESIHDSLGCSANAIVCGNAECREEYHCFHRNKIALDALEPKDAFFAEQAIGMLFDGSLKLPIFLPTSKFYERQPRFRELMTLFKARRENCSSDKQMAQQIDEAAELWQRWHKRQEWHTARHSLSSDSKDDEKERSDGEGAYCDDIDVMFDDHEREESWPWQSARANSRNRGPIFMDRPSLAKPEVSSAPHILQHSATRSPKIMRRSGGEAIKVLLPPSHVAKASEHDPGARSYIHPIFGRVMRDAFQLKKSNTSSEDDHSVTSERSFFNTGRQYSSTDDVARQDSKQPVRPSLEQSRAPALSASIDLTDERDLARQNKDLARTLWGGTSNAKKPGLIQETEPEASSPWQQTPPILLPSMATSMADVHDMKLSPSVKKQAKRRKSAFAQIPSEERVDSRPSNLKNKKGRSASAGALKSSSKIARASDSEMSRCEDAVTAVVEEFEAREESTNERPDRQMTRKQPIVSNSGSSAPSNGCDDCQDSCSDGMISPVFERYGEADLKPQLVAGELFSLMEKPLRKTRSEKEGFIYILKAENLAGYLKIGFTENPKVNRKKSIEKCYNHRLKEIYPTFKVLNHSRVESLVHTELHNFRLRHLCHSDCNSKSHEEWFKVDEGHASKVVNRWIDWMERGPYCDKTRVLQPLEAMRVKYCEKDPRLKNEEMKEADLSQLLDSSLELPKWRLHAMRLSRPWDSICHHWKSNLILLLAFFLCSLFLNSTAIAMQSHSNLPMNLALWHTIILGGLGLLYAAHEE